MIPDTLSELLAGLMERGGFEIGQIRVTPGIELRHVADAAEKELALHHSPEAARHLAIHDDAGKYRPLKTAPTLRRGWQLRLASVAELRLALDYFYPAALGTWRAQLKNELTVVPLRETLGRQTGMYRVVGLITDEQIAALTSKCCAPSACRRRVLWEIEPGKPHGQTEGKPLEVPEGILPLLCTEACNLLIAEGRKIVKGASGT